MLAVAFGVADPIIVKRGEHRSDQAAIAHEAKVLRRVLGNGLACVYDWLRYDESDGALITPFIRDSCSMREHQLSRFRASAGVCAALGQALGTVHLAPYSDLPEAGSAAWVLKFRTPRPEDISRLSPASLRLLTIVGDEGTLRAILTTLGESWIGSALCHNDLKWDNILVHPRESETEPTQVKLIDWEMAGIGDPCWDVGTVLSEFLAFWALSIPIVVDESPDTYMHLARYPLEDLQPAIAAFWRGYAETMSFDAATSRERLIRSTSYAGARLIQTAYERTQTMNRLTPQIYLLLQLSLNVLERPEEAAQHLLGIAA